MIRLDWEKKLSGMNILGIGTLSQSCVPDFSPSTRVTWGFSTINALAAHAVRVYSAHAAT